MGGWIPGYRLNRVMNTSTKISSGFLFFLVLVAVLAPWVAPYSYQEQDSLNILAFPGSEHWLGTDRLGRDLLSRMIYGARVSLFVGVFSTVLALIIGTIYGTLSAYVGGRTDNLMMRVVDVVFALPDLLMIILITVLMGRGVIGVFIALTLVSWVTIARLVRGEVLRIKEYPYILAARALGASHYRIMSKEIFPNILGILVVTLSFRVPVAILAESTLSFVGLGIAPPASSWGTLASDGWTAIKFYPHLILFPSLAIFFTILSFNFLGEGLREFLDPRSAKNS
ncbi:MAG: oligopeptide transport system permease protein [Nitrospinales bacterium]|jgi:oligopeptide transport system permease protein